MGNAGGRVRLVRVAVVAWAMVCLAVVVFDLALGAYGVGAFDQEVLVDATKPVTKVSFSRFEVADGLRRRFEATADPKLFDFEPADPLGGNRYVTQIRFSTRPGILEIGRKHHWPHLVILIEFADETRAGRVIDVPNGGSQEPLVVRVR
jgi:hypothetical protein